MKLKFDVSASDYAIIRDVLADALPLDAKVWVFGSRAKGTARFNSDLDLAVESESGVARCALSRLKEAFEDAPIPYRVDIVDLLQVDPGFRKVIETHRVRFPLKRENAPELRFPGFEGEWELRSLSEFMTFKNGVNADKSMYGHGRKFISVLDVIADRPICHDGIIGEVSISEGEFEKNEVIYGDILFQRSSEVREEAGQSNVYLDAEQSATFGGFVIRGRPISEFDPLYFNALLKTSKARKDVTSRSGGSTRFNIGQESLGAVQVNVAPTLPEQKKIAAFLGAVDAKVAALQARREGLERYKRGLMQALFSHRLRFTKPDGSAFPDWEEKRLGEVVSFSKGKGIAKSDVTKDGALPCIRYGELYTIYDEVIREVNSKTDTPVGELVLSKAGDVIVPASGEDRLDMARASCVCEEGVALGGDLNVLRGAEDGVFLAFYLTNARRKEIARYAQGNSVVHLYGTQLSQLQVELPYPDEQHLIADALSAMDAKIEAVSGQIARTETFKKGLLQQMFV